MKKVEEACKSNGEGEERSTPEEGDVHVDTPEDDYSKGIVFYMKEDNRKIVGVLTWNLFGKMDLAREVCVLYSTCLTSSTITVQ